MRFGNPAEAKQSVTNMQKLSDINANVRKSELELLDRYKRLLAKGNLPKAVKRTANRRIREITERYAGSR